MYKKTFLVFLLVLALSFASFAVFGADEEVRKGGTVNFPAPYQGSITSLDPAHSNRNQSTLVYRAIFDNLVKIDPESLEIVPGVANEWAVSEDGMTYTFYMREGVKFHNGTEVTASDVKYTYERLVDPEVASVAPDLFKFVEGSKAFSNGEAEHISGIEIIDPYTIRIKLTRLQPNFLYNVAGGSNFNAGIVPKEVVEEVGDKFTNNPIGCGPFKFEKWNRGSSVTVTKFEDYYGTGPYQDKIVFKIMSEAPARVAAFRSEQLDFDIVYPSNYAQYKKDVYYSELLVETAELWTRNVTFNMDLEKFQDKSVRQAFNYAIDEDLIIEKLAAGKAYPAAGWLPTSSPAYNPDLEPYGYDPEKAKELMEEAGYTSDNPLKIEIIGGDHPIWGTPMVETIKPYLDKVGFKIKPVLLDGATFEKKVFDGDFDAFIWSNGGEITSLSYMKVFWSETPRASGNFFNYSNPEFDKIIEKAMKETEFEERKKLIQQADAFVKEAAPAWFFNYNKAVGIHQPWLHGVVAAPQDMVYQPLNKLWVDEQSPRS